MKANDQAEANSGITPTNTTQQKTGRLATFQAAEWQISHNATGMILHQSRPICCHRSGCHVTVIWHTGRFICESRAGQTRVLDSRASVVRCGKDGVFVHQGWLDTQVRANQW